MPKKKAKREKQATVSSASKQPQSSSSSSSKHKPEASQIPLDKLLWSESRLAAAGQKRRSYKTEEILPGFVWVVHDFFLEEESEAWIEFLNNSKLDYVQHPATKYVANRECFRWQRNDTQIAAILFERMKHCGIIKELETKVDFSDPSYVACACNPNIRLYKYEKGMAFGKHVDGSHPVEALGQTEVTVLVYLNDCPQGGATRFYPNTSGRKKSQSIAFAPQKGAMLVHIHGDRCLEHEADPVVTGVKYILRTDLVYSSS